MDLRRSSIMECKTLLDGLYLATGLLALLLCSGVTGISLVNLRSSSLPIFHQHDRPLSTSPKSERSKRGDLVGTDEDPGSKMSIVDLTSDNILFANLSVDGNLYGYSVPDNGNGKPTIIRFHFADLRANVSALPSVSYSIITTSSNMDKSAGILFSARQMFPQISIGDAISLKLSLQNTATLRIPGNTSTLNANAGCQFSAHIGTLQANFGRISVNASASDISVDAIQMQNGRSAQADSEFLVISSSGSIRHQEQRHLQLRAQTAKTLLNISLGLLDNLTVKTTDQPEFLQFILTKSRFLIQSKRCQISFSNNTLNTTLRFSATGVLQRAQLGNILLYTLGTAADESKPPTVSMTIQGRSVVKLSSQRKETSSSETLADNKLKGSIDSSNATVRIVMRPCRIQALFSNPTAIWTAEYGLRTTSKQFQLDLPHSLRSAFAINVDGLDIMISRLSSTDALDTDHRDEVPPAQGGVSEGSNDDLTNHHEPLESAPLNSSEELSQIQITSIVDDTGSVKGNQDAGGNNAQGKFMDPLDDSSLTSGSDEGTSSVIKVIPTNATKTSTTSTTTATTTTVVQPDVSTVSHFQSSTTTNTATSTSKTTTATATTTTTTSSSTWSATTSVTANISVLIAPTSTTSSAEFTATATEPTIATAIKELPATGSLITNDVSINGNPTLSMWRDNANVSADNTSLSGFLVVTATIAVLPDFVENLSNATTPGISPPGVFPSVTTAATTTIATTTPTPTTTTSTTTTSTSTHHNILLFDKPLLDKYALELKIAGQSRPNNASLLEKLRQNLAAAYNEAQTRSNLRENRAHSKGRNFEIRRRSHDNHKEAKFIIRRASKPRNLELKVAETEESKAGVYEEAQIKILNIAKQSGSELADVLFIVNNGNETIDAATAKQIFDGLTMDDLATLLDLPIYSPVMTFEEVHKPSKSKVKAQKSTASNNSTSHVPSAVIALMAIAGVMLLLLCCLPISIAVCHRRTKNVESGFINNNLQSGFRIPEKSGGNNNLLPTFDELSLQRSDSSSLYATIEKPVVAAEARATVARPLPPRPLEFEHSRSITEVKLHQPAKEQCMSEVEDASLVL